MTTINYDPYFTTGSIAYIFVTVSLVYMVYYKYITDDNFVLLL